MILSASRRTDIPAFFPRWFMARLREGFVLSRNPMNLRQVSRVSLSPETIDCIVFWTKNPAPLLPFLDEIGARFPFYFQFTLNAYGPDAEPWVPPLAERLATLRLLSGAVGRERIVWRYDPVFLSPVYDAKWHTARFGDLAREIAPFASGCVFSFLDFYPKIGKRLRALNARVCDEAEMRGLGERFSAAGKQYGLSLSTCAEAVDLSAFGIRHGCCIDPERIEKLTGRPVRAAKDRNQRPECGCAASVDIGAYNTCRHGCRYCYANFSPESTAARIARHDENSPLLVGGLEPGDRVTKRKTPTPKKSREHAGQGSLFT
ncbi:MAG: DUF1848 domain-containing protein [Schwartzia sp.]|nr:DUF1848 domain-containing protein [Schwartzia sp. (in: firmicutes)]MBR1886607.1 DUF1848 domain-containing protein [Schwartzia sp. (in: firmicutes)]